MSTLSKKLASAEPDYRDWSICMKGRLNQRLEAARLELRQVQAQAKLAERGKGDARMSGSSVRAAQKTLDALIEEAKSATVTIRLFAVSFGEYNKFVIQNPPRKAKDEAFNNETFWMFVARRTGKYLDDDGELFDVDDAEWDRIEKVMTDGDHDRLAQTIFMVNRQDSTRGLDFTSGGSDQTLASSETLEPPVDLGSLTDD